MNSRTDNFKLMGFSDSDYEGNLDDGRSIRGYVFNMGLAQFPGNPKSKVLWHYLLLRQNTCHFLLLVVKLFG